MDRFLFCVISCAQEQYRRLISKVTFKVLNYHMLVYLAKMSITNSSNRGQGEYLTLLGCSTVINYANGHLIIGSSEMLKWYSF